jgi:hypothetical protein
MNPENLYEKYQQLLEENQLLRNRIASLEATIKNTGVSLVEDGDRQPAHQTAHTPHPPVSVPKAWISSGHKPSFLASC